MITTLITVCIAALVLYLIYWFISQLVGGVPRQIFGIIIALIFLAYVLKTFNILSY